MQEQEKEFPAITAFEVPEDNPLHMDNLFSSAFLPEDIRIAEKKEDNIQQRNKLLMQPQVNFACEEQERS
jgi:hypothetical protein